MNTSRARKRFGQHFLVDDLAIDRIVALIAPTIGEHIVEIGPGRCALTDPLVASGARVSVIEIDRDLAARIEQRYSADSNVDLTVADALDVELSELSGGGKLRVVGNLPYNISSPLIFRLLDQSDQIADMTFMLQKEVVDRLAAAPNSRDYGRLSVVTQFQCQVESYFEIPATAFDPPPRVISKLVRITPQNERISPAVLRSLVECVKVAFSQRRKTLRNTLGKHYPIDLLERAGLDLGLRAEAVTVEQFATLAATLTALAAT